MGCTYTDPRCASTDACYCGGEPENAPRAPITVQYDRQQRMNESGYEYRRRLNAMLFGTATPVPTQQYDVLTGSYRFDPLRPEPLDEGSDPI